MAVEKTERPYSWEEILSFDRIKRAVIGRVLDRIEGICKEGEPISPDQIGEIINDEWEKVRQAVRSSPKAREAFRKYLERTVSEQIEKLVQRDKSELGSLGVVEKGL